MFLVSSLCGFIDFVLYMSQFLHLVTFPVYFWLHSFWTLFLDCVGSDLGFGEVLDLSMKPAVVSSVALQPQIVGQANTGKQCFIL